MCLSLHPFGHVPTMFVVCLQTQTLALKEPCQSSVDIPYLRSEPGHFQAL